MIKLKSLLKEAPTAKATIATPKTWVDNFWNASGNLLNVVYWLSSLQLKAPKEIQKDAKLKSIINNLKKSERQLDKWYDKTDFTNLTEGKVFKETWPDDEYQVGNEVSEGPKTYDVVTTWWKVWVDNYKDPLTLIGKNEKSVKQTVHAMAYPAKIKIKRIKKIRQDIG